MKEIAIINPINKLKICFEALKNKRISKAIVKSAKGVFSKCPCKSATTVVYIGNS